MDYWAKPIREGGTYTVGKVPTGRVRPGPATVCAKLLIRTDCSEGGPPPAFSSLLTRERKGGQDERPLDPPEEFFEFIDRGGSSEPVERHLMTCPECLHLLDVILLAEAPATEEEVRLRWGFH